MSHFEIMQMVEDARKKSFLALDAFERARGSLEMENFSMGPIDYALKQIAMAMAWGSEVRHNLETVKANRDFAMAQELARKRLSDKTYTPAIDEVMEDPKGFIDGFREV